MSLESKIEALTKAVETLTAALSNQGVQPAQAVQSAPAPIPQQVQATPAPVAASAPAPQPVVATAPAMPALPTFAPTAPAPVATTVPFNDGKSLIEYVMARYKTLGPEKGAQIQNVLLGLGYQNINDIRPEQYAQFHAGVEGIQ